MATIAPVIVQYSAGGTSIPLEDEMDVMPTSDIAVDPPFDRTNGAYETGNRDQSLNFESPVIFNSRLPRYFVDFPISPAASADNDFVRNVFRLLADDDGVWRVRVSAEFERKGGANWADNHELAIRLYINGIAYRIGGDLAEIARVSLNAGASNVVLLQDEIFVRAQGGDVLQVRVFTDDQSSNTSTSNYDVELTGTPARNWVSFERIGN
jgi:hypothetical protein